MSAIDPSIRLSTGIDGLDRVLGGGLPAGRLYLVSGQPGTGKTTMALQFLLEGIHRGESILYFALSETREELQEVAASHGWSLNPEVIHEITPACPENAPDLSESYTLFHPSEVELDETMRAMRQEVERVQPTRIVLDSLAEMRLLAQDSLIYRRQILSLKPFLTTRQSTVLLLDDMVGSTNDHHFQSLVHGVITLQQWTPNYGCKRRQLEVVKLRGVGFHDGRHDLVIRKGGIIVYPSLSSTEGRKAEGGGQNQEKKEGNASSLDSAPRPPPSALLPVSSGVPELDALLGKGLDRGTSTLIVGPSGVGKSTLAMQYVLTATQRGERAVVYCFDEQPGHVFTRMARLGIDLRNLVATGQVALQEMNAAELAPGEFAHRVVQDVEKNGVRVVVIDSLTGYFNALPDDRALKVHLHELLTWLGQQGVVSMVILAQYGLVGSEMKSPIDVSYLADAVILLRYFEARGEVRRAISVVKKRTGEHESTIREFRVGPRGVGCGEPLRDFHGVLTGVPTWVGRDFLLGTSPEKGENRRERTEGEPCRETTSGPGVTNDHPVA